MDHRRTLNSRSAPARVDVFLSPIERDSDIQSTTIGFCSSAISSSPIERVERKLSKSAIIKFALAGRIIRRSPSEFYLSSFVSFVSFSYTRQFVSSNQVIGRSSRHPKPLPKLSCFSATHLLECHSKCHQVQLIPSRNVGIEFRKSSRPVTQCGAANNSSSHQHSIRHRLGPASDSCQAIARRGECFATRKVASGEITVERKSQIQIFRIA